MAHRLEAAGGRLRADRRDYSRLIIAMRMEPQFRLLSERYATHGQFGLFGMMRADAIQEYRAAFTRVQHVGVSTFA